MSLLARSQRRLAGKMREASGSVLKVRLGTIAAVTAGAAADGNAAVTVTVTGNTIPAPYLASYTPTVGHTVVVVLVLNSPLILGRVIGLPVV